MKVKNNRALAVTIITAILFVVCLIIYISNLEVKYAISSILSLVISVINFIRAFSKKGILEELADNADERDLYIVTKTSHFTIRIINYALCSLAFVFMLLYTAFKYQAFIIIACTLCAVLVLIFAIYLGVNIYLEKYE